MKLCRKTAKKICKNFKYSGVEKYMNRKNRDKGSFSSFVCITWSRFEPKKAVSLAQKIFQSEVRRCDTFQ